MRSVIENVTVLVARRTTAGHDLLLFEHPSAGIQIPAGIVEPAETIEAAALREAQEETGLRALSVARYLGSRDDPPPPGCARIGTRTTVYARPDPASFDWATLPRAATVRVDRSSGGFVQVTYLEHDGYPNPSYSTFQITGWIAASRIATQQTRHVFLLRCDAPTPGRWEVEHRYPWLPAVPGSAGAASRDHCAAESVGADTCSR